MTRRHWKQRLTKLPIKPGSNSKSVYQGRLIDLTLDTVDLPNGKSVALEIVHHPGGAVIVAINSHKQVCLLRQLRYASGGALWELPAGCIDPGEDPLETARRELKEEAGQTAGQWQKLGVIMPSPGFCDERLHIYQASQLSETATAHEDCEIIEVHWIDWEKALDLVCSEEIIDGKTIAGLFLASADA